MQGETNLLIQDENVVKNLGSVVYSINLEIEKAVTSSTGLSCSACSAIVNIRREPNLSIERLRQKLDLQHSSVVRLVTRLADQGIVRKSRGSGKDSRKVALTLSEAGFEYYYRIIGSRKEVLHTVLSELADEERVQFNSVLSKLSSRFGQVIKTSAKSA